MLTGLLSFTTGNGGPCGSQQSSSALGGAAAAEQDFTLHAAHLVVIVPGQLCAGPDPPAQRHKR